MLKTDILFCLKTQLHVLDLKLAVQCLEGQSCDFSPSESQELQVTKPWDLKPSALLMDWFDLATSLHGPELERKISTKRRETDLNDSGSYTRLWKRHKLIGVAVWDKLSSDGLPDKELFEILGDMRHVVGEHSRLLVYLGTSLTPASACLTWFARIVAPCAEASACLCLYSPFCVLCSCEDAVLSGSGAPSEKILCDDQCDDIV
ncbi:hypothetical protein RRG08_033467 [Elysia crispata]|uniref:Uncharacterized protein n=1 Tax=Elysia crispata TaxID=231223 RepID=A0AAE1E4G4_9GAST|nr:hypothetical protein RRG08_033467 [Elysia crispata]